MPPSLPRTFPFRCRGPDRAAPAEAEAVQVASAEPVSESLTALSAQTRDAGSEAIEGLLASGDTTPPVPVMRPRVTAPDVPTANRCNRLPAWLLAPPIGRRSFLAALPNTGVQGMEAWLWPASAKMPPQPSSGHLRAPHRRHAAGTDLGCRLASPHHPGARGRHRARRGAGVRCQDDAENSTAACPGQSASATVGRS